MQAMHLRYQDSWDAIWRGLGLQQVDATLLPTLVRHYSEPARKYHTLQHLDACLKHLATLRPLADHPDEIALALWFHDAVYEIGASTNEARSAEWARASLEAAGAGADVVQRVSDMVMVTCHAMAPQTRDQQILLDVDLSILGARVEVFDAYEGQIRAEYAEVPQDFFQARRKRILGEFLARPRIYHTDAFHDRLEAQARSNLARSISRLGG
jgi:predicted metal-dependent HD superfamily phosphohydrolase